MTTSLPLLPIDVILEITKHSSDLRHANSTLYKLWVSNSNYEVKNITKSYCMLKLRDDSISAHICKVMEDNFPYLTHNSLDQLILSIDKLEFTFSRIDVRLARRYNELTGKKDLPIIDLYDSCSIIPKLISYRTFHFVVNASLVGCMFGLLTYIR